MTNCSVPNCGKDLIGQGHHSGNKGVPLCCEHAHPGMVCPQLFNAKSSTALPESEVVNTEGLVKKNIPEGNYSTATVDCSGGQAPVPQESTPEPQPKAGVVGIPQTKGPEGVGVKIDGQRKDKKNMAVDQGQVEQSQTQIPTQILVEHRSRRQGGNIYYIKAKGVTVMLHQKEAEKLARAMGLKG